MRSSRKRGKRGTTEQKSGSSVAEFFLELNAQLQAYHWQASRYSQHKALDKLRKGIRVKTDIWVEAFMGQYGRLVPTTTSHTISFSPCDQSCVSDYITRKSLELKKWRSIFQENTDLVNIMDEISASFNQTLYLLTLE